MSPRRKQSTKDLGELLNQAVPVMDEADEPAPEEPSAEQTSPDADADAQPETEASTIDAQADVVEVDLAEEAPADAKEREETSEPAEDDAAAAADADSTAPATSASTEPDAEGGLKPASQASADAEASAQTDAPVGDQREPEIEPPIQPLSDASLNFVEPFEIDLSSSEDPQPSPEPEIEAPEPAIAPVTWRKSTIPFREDQYEEIGRLLAEFRAEHGVQLTIAEFVRLGLDKQIAAFQNHETRTGLLVELYKQQQRESQGNENLKHSRSHGLGRFLDKK